MLKRCPFCAGVAKAHNYGKLYRGWPFKHGHRVECEGRCGAVSDYWHSKDAATSAWNERRSS